MAGGHFKNTAVPSGGSTRLRLRPSGRLPYPFATAASGTERRIDLLEDCH